MNISEELLNLVAEKYLKAVREGNYKRTFYQYLSRWLTLNDDRRTIVGRDNLV